METTARFFQKFVTAFVVGGRLLSLVSIMAVIALAPSVDAKRKTVPDATFAWDSVSKADWDVKADSISEALGAVMLFERIVANDSELTDDRTYRTEYRRIKILNSNGHKWADVKITYWPDDETVIGMGARTLLPDGRIIVLNDSVVTDKELVKTKGITIGEKAFSFPGVEDGCIVEYFVTVRSQFVRFKWKYQQDIQLLNGRFEWNYCQDLVSSSEDTPWGVISEGPSYFVFGERRTPNFIWLNSRGEHAAKSVPLKEPTSLVFTVANVPPFSSEPFSLPDGVLRSELQMYYGSTRTPSDYWRNDATWTYEALTNFCEENSKSKEILSLFTPLLTRSEKIDSVYRWVRNNVRNLTYLDPENNRRKNSRLRAKKKYNNTANDVYKNRAGSSWDISAIFIDLLRELEIDARYAFVVDRDEGRFVKDIKRGQFNRILVAVLDSSGGYTFYAPGELCLPPRKIPWATEGVTAYIVSDSGAQFPYTDVSPANSNTVLRTYTLTLTDTMSVVGKVNERRTGHAAVELRALAIRGDTATMRQRAKELISDSLHHVEVESLTVVAPPEIDKPVVIECIVSYPALWTAGDKETLIKPLELMRAESQKFTSAERVNPIVFDYAYDFSETINLTLPGGWKVNGVPPETKFECPVGIMATKFLRNGDALVARRQFRINRPMWSVADYPDVQKLFQTRESVATQTVALSRTN